MINFIGSIYIWMLFLPINLLRNFPYNSFSSEYPISLGNWDLCSYYNSTPSTQFMIVILDQNHRLWRAKYRAFFYPNHRGLLWNASFFYPVPRKHSSSFNPFRWNAWTALPRWVVEATVNQPEPQRSRSIAFHAFHRNSKALKEFSLIDSNFKRWFTDFQKFQKLTELIKH